MTNTLRFIAVSIAALVLIGCGPVKPYDYSALEASKPRSIVVIPPANNTVEVNAPYIYLSTISKPLAEKGFYVFPVSVIDHFMKENGLPTTAEMNTVPLEKIHEHIGADAVLYINIDEWGQKFQVLSSKAVVRATMKLVDARTGEQLWDSVAYAEHSNNNNNGGGLIGALAGAIADQIAGSITDHTPQLAQTANHQAINNSKRGLLNGPYVQPKTAKAQ